jgi:hypothetical protein
MIVDFSVQFTCYICSLLESFGLLWIGGVTGNYQGCDGFIDKNRVSFIYNGEI